MLSPIHRSTWSTAGNHRTPIAVVVNDDPNQINLLSGLLCKAGLEPRAFSSAEAALAAMSTDTGLADRDFDASPALIVTGLYLPGIDGWRFCRLLRSPEYAAFNQVPIFVVSDTFAGEEATRIAADLGAEAFLTSPVDGRRFCEQVRALLSGERVRIPLRVLIVDDDAILCDMLKEGFASEGYQADTALTAQAAIEAFKKTAYDVAVLDYHLPDGSGDMLLEGFRAERPDCVCLMMTGETGPDIALALMKRGAAAFLQKPFKQNYLMEICARARRERALLRAQDLLDVRTRELRESEERFSTFMSHLPAAVFIKDASGRTLYANKYLQELLNFQNWGGKTTPELVSGEVGKTMVEDDRKAFAQGPLKIQETLTDCHGNRRTFETIKFPIHVEGKPLLLGGVAIDITERKQVEEALRESEARLHLITDNVPAIVAYVNAQDLRYQFVNRVFADMFDLLPESMIGKRVNEILGEAAYARALPYIDRVRAGERIVYDNMVPVRGEQRWFNMRYVPEFDEHGVVQHVVVMGVDLTERKQAEEEKEKLEAQNRQLQKAESLSRMAGAIAHHFNNKLQAVMGNLELAMNDLPRNAGPIECLTEALQSAHKAAEVSRLMLTYLGQTVAKRVLLDLSATCQQSLSLLRAGMPKDKDLGTDLPLPGPAIRADANQILQVLNNLVTNAWEASGDGRGAICLTIKTVAAADIPIANRFPIDWQPHDNAYACLEVADAGCGIADQDTERIFDPFFSRKLTGRGMGLAVVLGIVRAHHGAITVESKPGWGSVFRVFFPVSAEAVPPRPFPVDQAPTMAEGGTVLVVDDEPFILTTVVHALKRRGFTVLVAQDGIEAVEVFREHRDEISCVLCDLTMPRMNGWETLTALRELAPGIPVILASGHSEAQVMKGHHPELPQAFLEKPYELKALDDAIARVMTNKKASEP